MKVRGRSKRSLSRWVRGAWQAPEVRHLDALRAFLLPASWAPHWGPQRITARERRLRARRVRLNRALRKVAA